MVRLGGEQSQHNRGRRRTEGPPRAGSGDWPGITDSAVVTATERASGNDCRSFAHYRDRAHRARRALPGKFPPGLLRPGAPGS